MNFESELAELDDREYRKLKRVIIRNKSEFRGLDEKGKLSLLAGWIDVIKEERSKKVEELPVDEEVKEELKVQSEEVVEAPTTFSDEPSRFNWKMIFGIALLVLLLIALVFASFNLLKPSGKVKFVAVKDYSIFENDSLSIDLVAKHANNFSVANLPAGAVFSVDRIVWVPNFSQSGSYLFTACAFNNISSDCTNISVKVKDKNIAPKLVSAYPKSRFMTFVGKSVIFFINASDFDKYKLSYSWSLGGAFGKKVVDGNMINITFGSTGKKIVKVRVSDGEFSVVHSWIVEVVSAPVESKKVSYVISGAVFADQDVVSYIIGDEEPSIKVEGDNAEESSFVIGDGSGKTTNVEGGKLEENSFVISDDSAIKVERVGNETSSSYVIDDESIKVVSVKEPESAEFVIG